MPSPRPEPAVLLLAAFSVARAGAEPKVPSPFVWPEGKRFALSLSFDDARVSQVEQGTAFLDRKGVKVTFYVVPRAVEERLAGWKQAAFAGHEIGNHSLRHPCSGNFAFSRRQALEEMSLEAMHDELVAANERIHALLGVKPETFAYPCGQTFVGRAQKTRSYVPLVAGTFLAGRGFKDEVANDPGFCDLARLGGQDMDGMDWDQVQPLVEQAAKEGRWLILAGHEMGEAGPQTTRFAMLEALVGYAADPGRGVWLAPVGQVARYVRDHRRRP